MIIFVQRVYLLVAISCLTVFLCFVIGALHIWGSYKQHFVIQEMAERVEVLERECVPLLQNSVGEKGKASGPSRERGEEG